MSELNFKNRYFFKNSDHFHKVDFGPSLTEPDQSLSINQILERVAQGFTTGLKDYTVDYDEEDNDDFEDPTLDSDFNEMDAINLKAEIDAERKRKEDERRAAVREYTKRNKQRQQTQGQQGTLAPGQALGTPVQAPSDTSPVPSGSGSLDTKTS